MPTKSTDTQKIKELKNLYNIIEITLTRDDAEPIVNKGKSIRGFKFCNNQTFTNLDSTGKGSENVLDLKSDTGSSNDFRLDTDREFDKKIQLHRKYDERVRLAINIWETYPDCSEPPMSNPSPKIGLHELKAWAMKELKKEVCKNDDTNKQKKDGQGGTDDIAIEDKELTILVELAEGSDKTYSQVEIEAATSIPRGTIKDKLPRLENIGLINRPLGKRKGYQITDKGREIAHRNE